MSETFYIVARVDNELDALKLIHENQTKVADLSLDHYRIRTETPTMLIVTNPDAFSSVFKTKTYVISHEKYQKWKNEQNK